MKTLARRHRLGEAAISREERRAPSRASPERDPSLHRCNLTQPERRQLLVLTLLENASAEQQTQDPPLQRPHEFLYVFVRRFRQRMKHHVPTLDWQSK